MQWNVRSYQKNKPFIQSAVDDYKPDAICLHETWAKPTIDMKLNSYTTAARRDRENIIGVGVSVHIKTDIPNTKIELKTNLEAAATKVYLPSYAITLCSLYLSNNVNNPDLINELNKLREQLPVPFLILTDINGHHSSWGSDYCDARGKIICDWLDSSNLAILNDGTPTRLSGQGLYSHIDLSITTQTLASLPDWEVILTTYHSDHFPILISFSDHTNNILIKPKWITAKANWDKFRELLSLPSEFMSPSTACSSVEASFNRAAAKSIPYSENKPINKLTSCWWNEECSKAKREKQKALNRYKNHVGSIELWIEFKKKRAKFIFTINKAKKESWKNYVQSINKNTSSAEIWKKVKKLRSTTSVPAIIVKSNNEIITDLTKTSNMLAREFSNRGTEYSKDFSKHKQLVSKMPIFFLKQTDSWYNVVFTMDELNDCIEKATSSSPGPDNIPYEMIKNSDKSQKNNLLNFYNYIWKQGIPFQWKQAEIIPIKKEGKPAHLTSSYRPIALTNCLCKLMERLVNARLHKLLTINSLIDPHQSGFLMGHSTNDPLTRLETDIRTSLIEHKILITVFLDIKQAFDAVWHYGLLKKIKDMEINGRLATFLQDFITNRRISVRSNNTISDIY